MLWRTSWNVRSVCNKASTLSAATRWRRWLPFTVYSMCWWRILSVNFQCGSQPQNEHRTRSYRIFTIHSIGPASTVVWCQQIAVHCIGKKCPLHSIKILTNGLKVKACKMRVHHNEIKTSERNENKNDFHTRWQYPPPFKMPQIPAFLWPLLVLFLRTRHTVLPKEKHPQISGVNLSCLVPSRRCFVWFFQPSMYFRLVVTSQIELEIESVAVKLTGNGKLN